MVDKHYFDTEEYKEDKSFETMTNPNDAISAITDESKLEEFKMKHEKRNRTSMSQWVSTAWDYGKSLGASEDQPQTV